MKDQINTIRAALNKAKSSHGVTLTSYPPQDAWQFNRVDQRIAEALTTLTQLEAMVGEPVGEVYRYGKDSHGRPWHGIHWYDAKVDVPSGTKLYTAAPVAQQYEAGDMASAAAQGFRDGVASVAQQQEPVAWAMPKGDGTFIDVITPAEHARDEGSYTVPLFAHPVAQQPQAEPFGYVSQHTNGTWEFSPTPAGVYPDTAKSITAVYTKQPQAEAAPVVSTTHELKLLPEYFTEVRAGTKTFELRKDDRGFKVGDTLRLREWHDPNGFTGQQVLRRVVGMLRGPVYGLADGYVILSIAAPQQAEAVPADVEVIRKALERAFIMGQNYWADADSESYSANKRSDVIRQKFNAMRDEVCAAIAQQKGGV